MARVTIVALLLFASAAVYPAVPAATDHSQPCVGFTLVPGQGPSCPVPGGWEVLLEDGSRQPTHGPDYLRHMPVDTGAGLDGPLVDPYCVAAGSSEHHMRVIYARPSNLPDNYATKAPQIRDLIKEANGILRASADPFGVTANFKVRCSGGVIIIENEALPTSSAADSFASITQDLKNRGYTSTQTKYWVYYDDAVGCGCAGQGTVYNDDRLIAENYNNAAPGTGPMFALSYGYMSVGVMMHENGHNQGAVQNSAPTSSGAYHCNDGRDIMCYADGGPNSAYNPNVCASPSRFDCNNNDYFHPAPPGGSYLATHWNLGSALNRFIKFGSGAVNIPPVAAFGVTCTGLACDFDGTASSDADGAIASYSWSFGGTGTSADATPSHVFPSAGTYAVSLQVTDNEGAQDTTVQNVVVSSTNTPPVTVANLAGSSGLAGWYRSTVTVTLTATDNAEGVDKTFYRMNGGAWQTYSAPLRAEAAGSYAIDYYSRDNAANVESVKSVSFKIDRTAPVITNVVPDGGVWIDGDKRYSLPNGRAVLYDSNLLNSKFPVEADIRDALSQVYDVLVYGGNTGQTLQCTDGGHAGPIYGCPWQRSVNEHGRQVLRIVARDNALNQAVYTVEIFG